MPYPQSGKVSKNRFLSLENPCFQPESGESAAQLKAHYLALPVAAEPPSADESMQEFGLEADAGVAGCRGFILARLLGIDRSVAR